MTIDISKALEVVTSGDLPRMYASFYAIPQVVRFAVSGNLGNLLFFFFEKTFYARVIASDMFQKSPKVLQSNKQTFSFIVSYLINIVPQHFLNAVLVFGLNSINTVEKYVVTLSECYVTYGFAMVGSTATNSFLLNKGISKDWAFFVSIYGFSVLNYIVLNWLSKRATEKNGGILMDYDVNIRPISRGGALSVYNEGDRASLQDQAMIAAKNEKFDILLRHRNKRNNNHNVIEC